jgi:hypothetical protein
MLAYKIDGWCQGKPAVPTDDTLLEVPPACNPRKLLEVPEPAVSNSKLRLSTAELTSLFADCQEVVDPQLFPSTSDLGKYQLYV